MSVSSVLASQDRLVAIDSAAAVTSRISGVASACARSVSHSTHTVTSACTVTAGQKSGRAVSTR